MEIPSSRVLLRPIDLARTQTFYRDVVQLAVAREFDTGTHAGVVFFLGNGQLEVACSREADGPSTLMLWLQTRDVHAELERLATPGVEFLREARTEPWGLIEGWIEEPDGTRIVLVQVPEDHPIRRDQREL